MRNTGVRTGSTITARASTSPNINYNAFASVVIPTAAATATACIVPDLIMCHYNLRSQLFK